MCICAYHIFFIIILVICLWCVLQTEMLLLFTVLQLVQLNSVMGCYRRWRSSFTFSLFMNQDRSLVATLLADCCSPSCLQTPALRDLFGFADKFLLKVGGIELALCPEREPENQIRSVTVVVVYSDTRIWCSASQRKRLSLSAPHSCLSSQSECDASELLSFKAKLPLH